MEWGPDAGGCSSGPRGPSQDMDLGLPQTHPVSRMSMRPQVILTDSSPNSAPWMRLYEPPIKINPVQTGDSWDIVTDVSRSQSGALQRPTWQAAAEAEPRQSARCPRHLGTPEESRVPAAAKPATDTEALPPPLPVTSGCQFPHLQTGDDKTSCAGDSAVCLDVSSAKAAIHAAPGCQCRPVSRKTLHARDPETRLEIPKGHHVRKDLRGTSVT